MAMITLLRYFTYAAAAGSTFQTEWVRVPEGHQIWQLAVQVHSRISTTAATVQLQTTWDTSQQDSLGSAVTLATIDVNPQDVSTGMGPMVRLAFVASAESVVVVSVWLTAKSQ